MPSSVLTRLRRLQPYLRRYKKRYVIGLTALVLTQVVGVTIPLVIRRALDRIQHSTTPLGRLVHFGPIVDGLLFLAGILLALQLGKSIFLFLTRWVLIGISRDVEYDLRNDLFRHLERLDARYYTENRTGDLMAKLTNDLAAVRNIVGPGIMYSANTVVLGVLAIAVMLYMDPRLTLLALLPLPLASLLVKFFGQKIHERFEKIQALYSELTEKVRESLAGVRVIRAFCQEEAERRSFDRMNGDMVGRNKGLIWISSFLWPGLALLFAASTLLIMVVGGWQVVRHDITVGTFVAFTMYLMYLIWPIIALGWVTNIIQRGLASLGRLWKIFEAEPDISDREVPEHPLNEIRGDIEFRNLTFSYNGSPILKDINLRIPAGTTVGLVGATGAGKSTLASLIARLYDAPAGAVLVDGVPIREIPLRTLRESIGFVPQDTFLFSETVRENIRFGKPSATERDVERAAETSHILPEIGGFPKGFDTMVGERGLTLSGGQKQRVAISRAVLRDPRILILDDALSHVDTYTEEAILRHLTRIMAGRTTLMISHRVSTIRHADWIIVLRHGEIAEQGTHEELLALNGYYADLYSRQLIEEALEKEA